MGAGFRGSSTLFQTASEFLKTSKNETLTATPMSQEPNDNGEEQERKPETKRSKSSSPVSLSSSSPSKRSGKALSKKQQKLAEAAKNSHCISQYFGKKVMDYSPKNGQAIVLEPEETGVFVETPHIQNVSLNTNNTETQHECNENNARAVKHLTTDVTPMDLDLDMSTTEVEICRAEEIAQGFEARTILEAEWYVNVTLLVLFLVFLFLCSSFDHRETVRKVLSILFSVCSGRSHSLMPGYNQKR